jgi:hypothetical protein
MAKYTLAQAAYEHQKEDPNWSTHSQNNAYLLINIIFGICKTKKKKIDHVIMIMT